MHITPENIENDPNYSGHIQAAYIFEELTQLDGPMYRVRLGDHTDRVLNALENGDFLGARGIDPSSVNLSSAPPTKPQTRIDIADLVNEVVELTPAFFWISHTGDIYEGALFEFESGDQLTLGKERQDSWEKALNQYQSLHKIAERDQTVSQDTTVARFKSYTLKQDEYFRLPR